MVHASELMRYEEELTREGCRLICGVDEVGRGPLAGPVTCAAVIMPLDALIEGVNDSKKVAKRKRERLAEEIKSRAIAWSVVSYDNRRIDEMNILAATKACMAEAVMSLAVKPDVVIVDADEVYPGYGFANNVGYGTAQHIAALKELGATPIHRRTFIGHFVGTDE